MINNFLINKIKEKFLHETTEQQSILIEKLSEFIVKGQDGIFLLKGYAGTGKTSVMSALVKVLLELKQSVLLAAPTGRAAKVISFYSGKTAFTIHKLIYRQKSAGDIYASFDLNVNFNKNTLFVVDEGSMISNSNSGSSFGSGALLDDLIKYVYSGDNCKLIIIGDTAQLPPIGRITSQALDKSYLQSYGFFVEDFTMTEVVRQTKESGILYNATYLRNLIIDEFKESFPKIDCVPFTDIKKISGEELIDLISSAYSKYGVDETIVITRSNKRSNIFNNGIRNRVLYREEELSSGDLLMIVKNNYFWSKEVKEMGFIANGDVAEVKKIRNKRELYGFRFADVTLYFVDYDVELDVTVLLDTLQSESPSLTFEESNRLFEAVQEDYSDIGNKRDRMLKMRENPYLNALQIKFGYAVTCHKAQGGQWSAVFLDQGYLTKEMVNEEYLRWLYTAFTRATEKLYLVNWIE